MRISTHVIEVRVEVITVLVCLFMQQPRPGDRSAAHGIPAASGKVADGGEPEAGMLFDLPAIGANEDRRKLTGFLAVIAAHPDPAVASEPFVKIVKHRKRGFLNPRQIR